jgi:hypothetical protein
MLSGGNMLESFVLGIVIGMGLAYVMMRIVVWATLRQMERQGIEIENLVQKIKQDAQASVIEARLEQHQGEFFLYRKDTGEFIAQGATAQEITERTDRRIYHMPVVVTEADEGVLERYRATKTMV